MLRTRNEAERCLLCADAPCTAACPAGQNPARMLQAVRFDRESGAGTYVSAGQCEGCSAPCEQACIHFDTPIRIREVASLLPEPVKGEADLSIDFCGVHCENPFFLSSSVVASGYEMCAKALSMGWAGVVYKTVGIFTPNEVSPRFGTLNRHGAVFGGFRNMEQISDHPLERDLEVLRRLKKDFPTKVIVGSIMGSNEEEWTRLAQMCTEAGCDIIECNFSCPQMTAEGMGSDVGIDPELVAKYTAAAKRGTDRPVLAKMTPNITNMEVPAIAAMRAGADGLAAINTIKSITGFELPSLAPQPAVDGKSAVSGYSGKAVKPIALRFVRDLAVCPQLKGAPISGIGGIETWHDAAEFIALGCTNVQVTTSVMEYGYRVIEDMIAGLSEYLAQEGYSSLQELVGKGLEHIVDAEDLNRSTVSYPMFDQKKCVGCGRCAVSCYDGGHQAIGFGADRKPKLIGANCVGCHLCLLVCPAEAIHAGRRVTKIH
jgi:dihydropyrimidine dehydrogenase (NAD+) subunit PreA